MIRRATLVDIPQLVQLAAQFIGSGEYWGVRKTFSPEAFAKHLRVILTSPVMGCFVATGHRDKVTGAIAVMCTPDVFSGGLAALKVHWIVDPEHGGAGMRLLLRGEAWARKQGATDFYVSAINDGSSALLTRLKFEHMETVYRKALTHGH